MAKSMDNVSDYQTRGMSVDDTLFCVRNAINRDMCIYGREHGVLFDLVGNLAKDTARVLSLKNWCSNNGKSAGFDEEMAKVTRMELASMGANVANAEQKLLLGANIMTGLAYVSQTHEDGSKTWFFATKNNVVLNKFAAKCRVEDFDKSMKKYEERLNITDEEIKGNYLNCVKLVLSPAGDSYKMRAGRVHVKSKNTFIAPVFVADNYNCSVISALKKGIVSLTVKTSKGTKQIKTSLVPAALRQYSTLSASDAFNMALSTKDLLVLRVFDFVSMEIVDVSLLDVVSIGRA